MSKINIKIDFKDGEKLFGSQLNNNFKVIMEALNNNDAVLAENIAIAKAELKSELDAITANRGWNWDGDGNPRVTYKRAMTTAAVEALPIVDGQILASGEGATFIDYNGNRLGFGGSADATMSDTSQNSVQNKVVKGYIDTIDTKYDYTRIAVDANNLKSTGNFFTTTSTDNIPSKEAGFLRVFRNPNDEGLIQFFVPISSSQYYFRKYNMMTNGSTYSWTDWTKVATDSQINSITTNLTNNYQKKISYGTELPTTGNEGDIFIKY